MKKLVFWCCKSLGLKTLQYLLTTEEYGKVFLLDAVVISSSDKLNKSIMELSETHGVKVYEDSLDGTNTYDLGFCIGFPQKIDLKTIHLCAEGVVNLHFAPLPKYRGSGTLTHAIINGEKEYGVTLHLMDENLDTGPIIELRTIPLSESKTALEIIKDIEDLAFITAKDNLLKIIKGSYTLTSQKKLIDEQNIQPIFCTRKSVQKLHELDPQWDFEKIYTYVRALTLGKTNKPYFKKNSKKIYLSLTED
jgi:methionyl-tRNA formyltransferase